MAKRAKDVINSPAASLDTAVVPAKAITITRIKVQKLLGRYDYDIPSDGRELSRVPILYGENGLGKTTLLKILYNLLSPEAGRGHRTALRKLKFRYVEVLFSNDVGVYAKRDEGKLQGLIELRVTRKVRNKEKVLGKWNWYAFEDGSEGEKHSFRLTPTELLALNQKSKTSQKRRKEIVLRKFEEIIVSRSDEHDSNESYCSALKEHVPPIFYLSSDRILSSDVLERRSVRLTRPDSDRPNPRSPIETAIFDAYRALSRIAIRATRESSSSMHSVHLELLKRLAKDSDGHQSQIDSEKLDSLRHRLKRVEHQYNGFASYGLAPKLDVSSISKILSLSKDHTKLLGATIAENYIETLEQQSRSLQLAYEAVDCLVSTANEFLFDKLITFSLGEGIRISNSSAELLRSNDLSSGEKQLLLLFCHISTAHDTGGIFIVDEPEISLNIKWQRKLVDSLLKLDRASNLQFLLASHSIELITKHRDSVFVLGE